MKYREEPVRKKLVEKEQLYLQDLLSLGEPVFIDIETTGLSWRRSHLYLIGIIWRKEGVWTFRQWFLDRPVEEDRCLFEAEQFLSELESEASQKGRSLLLVHFNGNTFDLPYLRKKLHFYHQGLQSRRSSAEADTAAQTDSCPFYLPYDSLDLYQMARPLKHLYGLSSMRQKDLEQFLGINREDLYSGGELISLYQDFLRTGDPETENVLLLHNHDDVEGMFQLLPLLAYDALLHKSAAFYRTQSVETDSSSEKVPGGTELRLTGTLALPLPVLLQKDRDTISFRAEGNSFSLTVPSYRGELKMFFPDFKNYFYLPLEDQAIHKSVAIYVDPEHRQKARAANCYQRVSGIFLPQPEKIYTPVFRRDFRDPCLWFRPDASFQEDTEKLAAYTASMIWACLSN